MRCDELSPWPLEICETLRWVLRKNDRARRGWRRSSGATNGGCWQFAGFGLRQPMVIAAGSWLLKMG